MPAQYIRRLTSAQRNEQADAQLGILLAFIAGFINAGGFLAIGIYTSHMSGIASSIGDYLVLHAWRGAAFSLILLLSFIFGSISSTLIINAARGKKMQCVYAIPIMYEALLLIAFCAVMTQQAQLNSVCIPFVIGLLCYIMGLQNALISKISQTVIRTTHITGIATDIGIEFGRYISRILQLNSDAVFKPEKLLTHLGLLLAFIIGGIVGAVTFKWLGFFAVLPPALFLALLALLPILDEVISSK